MADEYSLMKQAGFSDEEIMADAGFSPEEIQLAAPWSVGGAVKQFGSGAVRGLANTAGFLGDASGALFGNGFSKPGGMFGYSKQMGDIVEPMVSPKDPKYRYSEMAGEFAGPGIAARGAGFLGKIAGAAPEFISGLNTMGSTQNIGLDAISGLGAQGATDATGETVISPIVGAIGARALGSAGIEGTKALGRLFTGASDSRVNATAANVLQEYTKISPDEMRAALERGADDPLLQYKTTAELTQNAPMAQLQQELTNSGDGAAEFAQRWKDRTKAQKAIIDSGSTVPAINPEGLGSELIDRAGKVKQGMGEEAGALWKQFPRRDLVGVGDQQGNVASILSERQAGLAPSAKVQDLANQFLSSFEGGQQLESGALQNLREDALSMLRDANIRPHETRILSAIANGADDAIKASGNPETYSKWVAAREATKAEKEVFGSTRAGGSLINPAARPSNVIENSFKGDERGVTELSAAIGGDPALLEKYKRGVLDLIKTDSQGRFTTNRVKTFIDANQGGIKKLFGQEYLDNLGHVLGDLRSSDNVSDLATLASKRQSVTGQKLATAGVIKNLFNSSLVPGMNGPIAWGVRAIKEAVGDKAAQKVEKLLLKAVFDPEFAAQLAAAPTEGRVMSILEHLKGMVSRVGGSGVRAGSIGAANSNGMTERKKSPFLGSPNYANSQQSNGFLGNQKKSPNSSSFLATPQQEQPAQVAPTAQPAGGVDEKLVQAVIKAESAGDPKAVSKTGAKGLMQLMPAMAKAYGVDDPFDPEQNVRGGTALLEDEMKRFGDMRLALAAYNAGSPAVLRAIKAAGSRNFDDVVQFLPAETQNYVPKVLKYYEV